MKVVVTKDFTKIVTIVMDEESLLMYDTLDDLNENTIINNSIYTYTDGCHKRDELEMKNMLENNSDLVLVDIKEVFLFLSK